MITDVDHFAANRVALRAQALGFGRDPLRIDIEHRHSRTVLRQRFDVSEPKPARAAGHQRAQPINFEQFRYLHARAP